MALRSFAGASGGPCRRRRFAGLRRILRPRVLRGSVRAPLVPRYARFSPPCPPRGKRRAKYNAGSRPSGGCGGLRLRRSYRRGPVYRAPRAGPRLRLAAVAASRNGRAQARRPPTRPARRSVPAAAVIPPPTTRSFNTEHPPPLPRPSRRPSQSRLPKTRRPPACARAPERARPGVPGAPRPPRRPRSCFGGF